ncbi:MAG: FIST N-terminal domain-containing protein [Burkholderiaceae bacterium]
MTETTTAITSERDSAAAGRELGTLIREQFKGAAPDAVIVFASAQHDYSELLSALSARCGDALIAGSSSAGEFSSSKRGEGQVSALALRSQSMRFSLGVGRGLSVDPNAAATQAVAGFKGLGEHPLPYRAALIMTDALAGHTDAVVEQLTLATGGNYAFFGGGAGDDGRFHKTHVFAGTEAITDAVVALEMQSLQPIGVGVSHGWVPTGPGFRVTEANGMRVLGLNGMPAVTAFEQHAADTGQAFDRADPLPFFLHNIIGIKGASGYRLRVPLGVDADGSISCAAAVPQGAIVHIMKTSEASAVLAAEQATRSALEALGGRRPAAALVFDCVATRLRLGNAFDEELKACAALLEPAGFIGCNTYGQIARAEGQFGGFHNCTAVVCVLPE